MINKLSKFILASIAIISINYTAYGESNLPLKDGKLNTLDYNVYAGKHTLDSISLEIENNKTESPESMLNLINYYCSTGDKLERDTVDRQAINYQLNKNSIKNKEVYAKLSNALKPPVNCKYIQVKSYGVGLDKDTLSSCIDYNYIELSTPQGTKILSQFDGLVEEVKETNGVLDITIKSSNGVKCVYSNIMKSNLVTGDKVEQYSDIGEQDHYSDNLYVQLKVLVDDKSIDPSLLYK